MKGLCITKCMDTQLAPLMARSTRTFWMCGITQSTRTSLGLHDYTKCINLWKANIITQFKGPLFTTNTRKVCQPVWLHQYSENGPHSSSCKQFYVFIFHVAVIFLLIHFPGITLRNKINFCEKTINIKVGSLPLPAVVSISTLKHQCSLCIHKKGN